MVISRSSCVHTGIYTIVRTWPSFGPSWRFAEASSSSAHPVNDSPSLHHNDSHHLDHPTSGYKYSLTAADDSDFGAACQLYCTAEAFAHTYSSSLAGACNMATRAALPVSRDPTHGLQGTAGTQRRVYTRVYTLYLPCDSPMNTIPS